MSEYMLTINAGAGETVRLPCPKKILGVYSTAGPISIDWDYNGNVAGLISAGVLWEPVQGFCPAPTSALVIKTTAAGVITVRCE